MTDSTLLGFVLHAHLPWVSHSEHPTFFEEDWLFEALERSYLPLLQVFEGWLRDGIKVTVCLSVSPTLLRMLADPYLQERFQAYLDRRSALLSEELTRFKHPVARYQDRRLRELRRIYLRDVDVLGRIQRLSEAGLLKLGTTAWTHALLPAFASFPGFVHRQVEVGLATFRSQFGVDPAFFWLPECGVYPQLDEILHAHGITISIVQSAPVSTCRKLRWLVRNAALCSMVWSPTEGFPGDARYLDFHADESSSLGPSQLRPFLVSDQWVPLRLQYRAVTQQDLVGSQKRWYCPDEAKKAAMDHVEQFTRAAQGSSSVVAFDAELFGHWWHEGPYFLDALARNSAFTWVGPAALPAAKSGRMNWSTWAEGGDLRVWLNEDTAAWWSQILTEVEGLERARGSCRPAELEGWEQEVAMASASDWTFLYATQAAPDYAAIRLEHHLRRCRAYRSAYEANQGRSFRTETRSWS